jgi:hypothetical protein
MGVIGSSGGGYAMVNPTQGNPMGEALQNVENSAFKYNAQRMSNEQNRQDAEQSKQDSIAKELEAKQKRDDKFKVESTGIQPVDVKIFSALNKFKTNAANAEGEYKKASSTESKEVAYRNLSNANSSMNQIASFNKDLKSAIDLIKENKGGVFDEESAKEVMTNGDKFNSGQWQLNVAEDNTITIDTFDLDENGKFTKMTGRNLTPQQLYKKFTPRTAVNYAGEGKGVSALSDFEKSIKLTETPDGKGNIIKEDINGESKAKSFAERMMNDDNSVYKIRRLMGLEPKDEYTEDDRKLVYEKVYSDAKSLLPKGIEPDYKSLERSDRLKQNAITNSNEAKRISIAQKEKSGGDKDVKVTVKNGIMGEETTITKNMSKEELADFQAQKAKGKAKSQEEVWVNPIGAGLKKVFSGKTKTNEKQSNNKPTKGQVVDGYKFLGGNPNDAKSWKKI